MMPTAQSAELQRSTPQLRVSAITGPSHVGLLCRKGTLAISGCPGRICRACQRDAVTDLQHVARKFDRIVCLLNDAELRVCFR
jgi:hypothetical protein